MKIKNPKEAIQSMDSKRVIEAVAQLKKITCYLHNMKEQQEKHEYERERLIDRLSGSNEYVFLKPGKSNWTCDDDDDISDHNTSWGGAGPDCIPGRLATAKI